MAYFNSRTLGFYPGVDEGDKEDANIPDEEVLDPYELIMTMIRTKISGRISSQVLR